MTVLRSEEHFVFEMSITGHSFDWQNCWNNSFKLIFCIQLHDFYQIIPIWASWTSSEEYIFSVIENIVYIRRQRNRVREHKSVRGVEMVSRSTERALFNDDQFLSELAIFVSRASDWNSRRIAKIVFCCKLAVAFIAVAERAETDERIIFKKTEKSLSYRKILRIYREIWKLTKNYISKLQIQ